MKRRCTTVISHINRNESKTFNTSNSDNVIVALNLLRINVQNDIQFNTLVTLQKKIDTESSVVINDERMDENNISEKQLSHQNPSEIIDHTLDNNEINLVNKEEEVDFTYIHSIYITNDICMNDDENYIHKQISLFLSSKNHEDLFSGTDYDSEKLIVRHQKNVILDF